MSLQSYILGNGVFSIGATAIALTRGGGKLTVERTFKEIVADGDYGPVEDRIRLDKEVAKLTMNTLEILAANMTKMYPALDVDTVTTTTTVKGSLEVVNTDYVTVKWTGKLANGKSCIIELTKAINMDNIDWSMVDKDEVIAQLVYTATYTEAARTTAPWSIKFVDAAI